MISPSWQPSGVLTLIGFSVLGLLSLWAMIRLEPTPRTELAVWLLLMAIFAVLIIWELKTGCFLGFNPGC